MNCQHARILIQSYLDGELDLVRSLDVERHMRGCAGCEQEYRGLVALRDALASGGLYYQAPAGLPGRLRTALREASATPQRPRARAEHWLGSARQRARWLGGAALLATVVLAAVLLARLLPSAGADERLAEEVLSSHVRSLLATHLTDVASTDQHTVKPWFDGKLDFAPPVVDLASDGFPLIGGRLDYIDNRRVAALVFQRHRHLINLFIWPGDGDAAPRELIREGYQLITWSHSGMTFWAASDVSVEDLRAFVHLYQQRAPAVRAEP